MTKDEDLSKYLSLIEYYKEQLTAIDTQSSYVQAAIADYTKAKITLEQLGKQDNNAEVLHPIGGSTYVNAIVKNPSNVLFDIGSGYVTEKKSDDAIKKIDDRIKNLQETLEKLSAMGQQLQSEAEDISNKAQKIMSEQR